MLHGAHAAGSEPCSARGFVVSDLFRFKMLDRSSRGSLLLSLPPPSPICLNLCTLSCGPFSCPCRHVTCAPSSPMQGAHKNSNQGFLGAADQRLQAAQSSHHDWRWQRNWGGHPLHLFPLGRVTAYHCRSDLGRVFPAVPSSSTPLSTLLSPRLALCPQKRVGRPFWLLHACHLARQLRDVLQGAQPHLTRQGQR
jgi:hypothetical protein